MKLYYAKGACSLADHIALVEAGSSYDLVSVDLKAKKTEDGRDYATINPKGYVPALELDDGTVLTENLVCLSYIADQSGRLMPGDGLPHWRVLETTAFITTEIHKNFKPFFNPAASDAEKDEAKVVLQKRFGTIADQLHDREFVVGDAISVADCYLFVMLMWARKNGLELPPALDSYFDRLRQRPAVTQALREEGLE